MDEKTEDVKGRAKEAAGALTNDDGLKREGKADQGAAAAKGKVEDLKDRAVEGIENAKDKAKEGVDRIAHRDR